MANTWTVTVEEDPQTKELVMPLPVDLLAQMGWAEGTELFWDIKDRHWLIKEKKKDESSKT